MIVALLGHKKDNFARENYAARSKESDSLYFKEKVNENHVLSKNIINPRERVESNTTKVYFGVWGGGFFFLNRESKMQGFHC